MVAGQALATRRLAMHGRRAATSRAAALVAVLAAVLTTAAPSIANGASITPDYAREDRWAQEIVPSVITGDAVYLDTPSRSRVLALFAEPDRVVGNAKGAVVIVHGLGVHPDWGLIGALRTGLVDVGLATLSVQMPVLASDAPPNDYPAVFGAANERLAAAIAFLRARKYDHVVIVSHSLGSAMVDGFLARPSAPRIDGWVTIGMQGDFTALTNEPVLDVTAENDLPQVRTSIARRETQLRHDGCSRHVVIAGADHFMNGHYRDLLAAVEPFVLRAVASRCR
jgi:hypothetical protein